MSQQDRGQGFAARVFVSALWVLSSKGTSRIASLARLAILARILTPHDFGLVGIAVGINALAEALSTTGIHVALLRTDTPERHTYDTAWTMGVIRGGLLMAIVILTAPLVAAFMEAPAAMPVLVVMALVPCIIGFTNIGIIQLRRDLTFGPEYALQAFGEVTGLVIAVPLALWTRSVWAIVAANVAQAIVRVAASYVIHPYRPRLQLERSEARTLLRYGHWVVTSSILTAALGEGLNLCVGRVLGVERLGLFRMARAVATAPILELVGVLGWVTVGAVARITESAARVREGALEMLSMIGLIAAPLSIGLALFAPELVHLALGDRWTPIVPMVRLLAIGAFAESIVNIAGSLFLGIGLARKQTRVGLIQFILTAALIYPMAAQFGTTGVAFTMLTAALAAATIALYHLRHAAGLRLGEIAVRLACPIAACLPMIACRWWIGATAHADARLAAAAIVGSALLYAGGVLLQQRVGWLTLPMRTAP